LEIQYADYAMWQREWLRGEVLDRQLAYWKKQLADAAHSSGVPTDRPRPRVQLHKGACSSTFVPKNVADSLKNLSQNENATMFMVLLTVFQALLSFYSGKKDLLVGVPVANRNQPGLEPLIGFFVNTLVIRGQMQSDLSLRKIIAQTRETCLDAYIYQDIPFDKLVEALQVERDLSRHPLIQNMFVLQNAPVGELSMEGLTLSYADSQAQQSHYDLHLAAFESEQGLGFTMTYDTDLFDESTIRNMLSDYESLLKRIAADPDITLGEYEMAYALENNRRRELEARKFKQESGKQLKNLRRK